MDRTRPVALSLPEFGASRLPRLLALPPAPFMNSFGRGCLRFPGAPTVGLLREEATAASARCVTSLSSSKLSGDANIDRSWAVMAIDERLRVREGELELFDEFDEADARLRSAFAGDAGADAIRTRFCGVNGRSARREECEEEEWELEEWELEDVAKLGGWSDSRSVSEPDR